MNELSDSISTPSSESDRSVGQQVLDTVVKPAASLVIASLVGYTAGYVLEASTAAHDRAEIATADECLTTYSAEDKRITVAMEECLDDGLFGFDSRRSLPRP